MGYQAPPPPPTQHYGYRPQTTNGLAIASMVLGIVGVVLFFFLAIPAILALIFGLVAMSQINRSGGVQAGRGMAIAGITLGALEILAFIGLIIAAATSRSGHIYFHVG